jgi:hypothetical protein
MDKLKNYFLVTAGVLAAAVCSLAPRPAFAQNNAAKSHPMYSTGPFQLHDGERALIGLLLPAVQRAKAPARFLLLNGQGKALFGKTPGPPQNSNVPIFGSFFDITYRAAGPNNPDGIFECREAANDPPIIVPSEDGILIGLLLPAVQRNGKASSPLATSMQSFDVDGHTLTHANLQVLDEFIEPGF